MYAKCTSFLGGSALCFLPAEVAGDDSNDEKRLPSDLTMEDIMPTVKTLIRSFR